MTVHELIAKLMKEDQSRVVFVRNGNGDLDLAEFLEDRNDSVFGNAVCIEVAENE